MQVDYGNESLPRCSFRDCAEEGFFEPQIVIPREGSDPMTIVLQLKVCDRHRKQPKRAFLSDDGLRHLAQLLRKHGYKMPAGGDLGMQFETPNGLTVPWIDPFSGKTDMRATGNKELPFLRRV